MHNLWRKTISSHNPLSEKKRRSKYTLHDAGQTWARNEMLARVLVEEDFENAYPAGHLIGAVPTTNLEPIRHVGAQFWFVSTVC